MDCSGCCELDARIDEPSKLPVSDEPTSETCICKSESDSMPDSAPGDALDFWGIIRMASSKSCNVTGPDGLCMNGEFPMYLLVRRQWHGFCACCTHSGSCFEHVTFRRVSRFGDHATARRVLPKPARASQTPKVVTCPCTMAVVVSVGSALGMGRKMSDWNESAWMPGVAGHNPRGKWGNEEHASCGECVRIQF